MSNTPYSKMGVNPETATPSNTIGFETTIFRSPNQPLHPHGRNFPFFLCDNSGNLSDTKVARWANWAGLAMAPFVKDVVENFGASWNSSNIPTFAFEIANAMAVEFEKQIGGNR